MNAIYSWNNPLKNLTIGSTKIHMWRVYLEEAASLWYGLQQNLSANARTKIEFFYFQKSRQQFIVRSHS